MATAVAAFSASRFQSSQRGTVDVRDDSMRLWHGSDSSAAANLGVGSGGGLASTPAATRSFVACDGYRYLPTATPLTPASTTSRSVADSSTARLSRTLTAAVPLISCPIATLPPPRHGSQAVMLRRRSSRETALRATLQQWPLVHRMPSRSRLAGIFWPMREKHWYESSTGTTAT